ncbi:DUF4188 domain-containing protein [Cytobacillus purgationiresistens]|uniref:Heme-degrading monooxygenase HmoA n=1 Tax=Cytobacillus purgationiresistens TaxID=863449 RepID=A0ABU0AL55_9BACI|nr:DUF4188 domain-containing protein [Cytobacillus purgationiresistens]MDQ0271461.1 heme-degrading monooxygenase HmoA [Cytobacillus purgationiresistens]
MNNQLFKGRYTAMVEEDFIVFIIGMRINKFTALSKWVPVAQAMGPMIKELYQNPEWGFLHTEYTIGWRTVMLTQYWRSYDQLEAYAKGKTHSAAWRNFNKKIGADGSVGIFHETYVVEKSGCEAMYSNMPQFGLAKAFNHHLITKDYHTSRQRLKKT